LTFAFDNTTTNVITLETVNLGIKSAGVTTATFSTSSLSAPLAAGTYTVTATYNGNSTFVTETSPAITQHVTQATTTTDLALSTNGSVYGQAISLIATVTPEFAGTPTGTVSFYVNGSTTPLATVAVTTKAGVTTATYITSSLPANSYSITATYNGNSNLQASSTTSAQFLTVSQNSSHVALAATTTSSNTAVTFTATVTGIVPTALIPTGSIAFYIDGVFAGNVGLNAKGKAPLTVPRGVSAGNHTITAVYSGDNNFTGSSMTVTFDFIVGRGT
jgi:hypothetical protein